MKARSCSSTDGSTKESSKRIDPDLSASTPQTSLPRKSLNSFSLADGLFLYIMVAFVKSSEPDGPLLVERREKFVILTLNRPYQLNTLDEALIQEMEKTFARLHEDREARAVVITGAGEAFCAGVEVGGVKYDPLNSRLFLKRLNRVFDLLESLPQPSVAAINGPAVAGGLELALSCTFRVGTADAKLGLPEAKLGLVAAVGTTYRLPRLVGFGRAVEMCLLGDLLDGAEAARIGLIHRVCPSGTHLDEAISFAQRLAEGPPVALSLMKDALYANSCASEGARLLEVLSASVNHYTQDKREGLQAFFEKRSPEFRGR